MNNMEHRVQYLRNSKGQPVGCVAIKLHQTGKAINTVTYQVSVLNPEDQFNRQVARQLALGRMVEKPCSVAVKRSASKFDITTAVFGQIQHDTSMPARARKATKMWLDQHPNDEHLIFPASTFYIGRPRD